MLKIAQTSEREAGRTETEVHEAQAEPEPVAVAVAERRKRRQTRKCCMQVSNNSKAAPTAAAADRQHERSTVRLRRHRCRRRRRRRRCQRIVCKFSGLSDTDTVCFWHGNGTSRNGQSGCKRVFHSLSRSPSLFPSLSLEDFLVDSYC